MSPGGSDLCSPPSPNPPPPFFPCTIIYPPIVVSASGMTIIHLRRESKVVFTFPHGTRPLMRPYSPPTRPYDASETSIGYFHGVCAWSVIRVLALFRGSSDSFMLACSGTLTRRTSLRSSSRSAFSGSLLRLRLRLSLSLSSLCLVPVCLVVYSGVKIVSGCVQPGIIGPLTDLGRTGTTEDQPSQEPV